MVSWRYIQMGEGTEYSLMDLGMPPALRTTPQMFFLEDDPAAVWDRFRLCRRPRCRARAW